MMSNSFDSTLKYFDLEPEEMWFVVKRTIAPQRREVVKKWYKKTAALMMGVGGLIMLLRYINEIVVSI